VPDPEEQIKQVLQKELEGLGSTLLGSSRGDVIDGLAKRLFQQLRGEGGGRGDGGRGDGGRGDGGKGDGGKGLEGNKALVEKANAQLHGSQKQPQQPICGSGNGGRKRPNGGSGTPYCKRVRPSMRWNDEVENEREEIEKEEKEEKEKEKEKEEEKDRKKHEKEEKECFTPNATVAINSFARGVKRQSHSFKNCHNASTDKVDSTVDLSAKSRCFRTKMSHNTSMSNAANLSHVSQSTSIATTATNLYSVTNQAPNTSSSKTAHNKPTSSSSFFLDLDPVLLSPVADPPPPTGRRLLKSEEQMMKDYFNPMKCDLLRKFIGGSYKS